MDPDGKQRLIRKVKVSFRRERRMFDYRLLMGLKDERPLESGVPDTRTKVLLFSLREDNR